MSTKVKSPPVATTAGQAKPEKLTSSFELNVGMRNHVSRPELLYGCRVLHWSTVKLDGGGFHA